MENNKQSYLRLALLVLIAFIIGVTIADDIKKTFQSPLLRIGNSQAIDQYLKAHSVRKLQLGAGSNNPQGWLNSDLEPSDNQVYIDATTTFPLPDQSFQYVFNEHLIEHLPWELGMVMLRESYRILANGGKIRIMTPNLTKFIQLLGTAPDAEAQRFIDAKFRLGGVPINAVPATYLLNRQMREWGHQFVYDPATLQKSLELVGFKQITQYEVTRKTDPVFQEVEFRTHHSNPDLTIINNWEAMAFEAVR
jgi:predicted SAM-dependent methyltransferase